MVCSTLQSSMEKESFTRLQGCLVTMFEGCTRQSKSSATSSGIDAKVDQISSLENKLSKNSRQWQNKINKQEAQIINLQNQNTQLKGLLDPKLLVNVISQAVTTSLKPMRKGGAGTNGTGYVSELCLWKPQPSQLAPGTDESLNPYLECQYCKDNGHLKENCIKLNRWLAMEQKK